MSVSKMRNIGAYLHAVAALASNSVLAGGGADGVAQNGLTIDREARDSLSLSALAVVHGFAALSATKTATISIAMQDSADGSTWATYDPDPSGSYVATVQDASGHFVATRELNLAGARRYVRLVVTPTLSATGTDTCVIDGTVIIGGSDELPNPVATAEGTSA